MEPVSQAGPLLYDPLATQCTGSWVLGSVVTLACDGRSSLVGATAKHTVPFTEHLTKSDVAGAQLPDGVCLPALRVTLHS